MTPASVTPAPNAAPVQDVCLPLVGCIKITGDITSGALIIIGLIVLAIIVGMIYLRRFQRTGGRILHQVQNDHTSNMRHDIDAILEGIRNLGRDIGGLREELRLVRTDALDDRQRLDRHLEDTETRRRTRGSNTERTHP